MYCGGDVKCIVKMPGGCLSLERGSFVLDSQQQLLPLFYVYVRGGYAGGQRFFYLSSEKEIDDSIKQRAMQGLCGVEDGERPRDVSTW